MENYNTSNIPAGELDAQARGAFIARTYNHLLGAICCFTIIEIALFKLGLAEPMAKAMLGVSWLFVLGGFVVLSWIARSMAYRATSLPMQYAALAMYVVGEAIIFVPLLYIADQFAPGAITSAALVTFLGFSALTAIVFFTRKDFSFLRGILIWGGAIAFTMIVAGVIFGFQLGTFFSVGMIALAGGAILYDTSNILYRYPEDRYVAASLELFADVALMLWYVLRIFISRR